MILLWFYQAGLKKTSGVLAEKVRDHCVASSVHVVSEQMRINDFFFFIF